MRRMRAHEGVLLVAALDEAITAVTNWRSAQT